MTDTNSLIYKIVTAGQWCRARRDGAFRGAPVDFADGYLHFSTALQVVETAAKHFAGQRDLVLVALDTASLGDALRWEISRGGDRFPHLYASLDPERVAWAKPLPLRNDGTHDFACLLS